MVTALANELHEICVPVIVRRSRSTAKNSACIFNRRQSNKQQSNKCSFYRSIRLRVPNNPPDIRIVLPTIGKTVLNSPGIDRVHQGSVSKVAVSLVAAYLVTTTPVPRIILAAGQHDCTVTSTVKSVDFSRNQ